MHSLVGREVVVMETRPLAGGKGVAVKVEGIPDGPVWLGSGYLEAVESEESGAA